MAEASSILTGVASRYAVAVFDLAREAGALDQVKSDLDRLSLMIAENADLKRLVRSPLFSPADQLAGMTAIMQRFGIGGLAANVVKVAVSNRRLFVLPEIIDAYAALLARQRGEVAAEVASAEPLSEGHADALRSALSAALGKAVSLRERVDSSLIGGLVVRVGSRMIDTSLRSKLNTLRLAMKEAR